jgi:hypothetical protein
MKSGRTNRSMAVARWGNTEWDVEVGGGLGQQEEGVLHRRKGCASHVRGPGTACAMVKWVVLSRWGARCGILYIGALKFAREWMTRLLTWPTTRTGSHVYCTAGLCTWLRSVGPAYASLMVG